MSLEDVSRDLTKQRVYQLCHGDYMVTDTLSKEECEDMLFDLAALIRVLGEEAEQGTLDQDTIPRMLAYKTVAQWQELKNA